MSGEIFKGHHGPLSSYYEWHAFSIGVYEGLKDLKPDGMDERARNNKDVKNEYQYAAGGYVIGCLLRYILILLAGKGFGII